MLISGTKKVLLKQETPAALTCPNCGSQGKLTISAYRKHYHVFWIPFVPIGRTGTADCMNCKHKLELKEMPDPVKQSYLSISAESRAPIWQYTGLTLLPFLIAVAIYSSAQSEKQKLSYIDQPQSGDLYYFKTDDGFYSAMKVVNVSNDSIYVVRNYLSISSMRKVDRILKDENFDMEESEGFSLQDLKNKYQNKEIISVSR